MKYEMHTCIISKISEFSGSPLGDTYFKFELEHTLETIANMTKFTTMQSGEMIVERGSEVINFYSTLSIGHGKQYLTTVKITELLRPLKIENTETLFIPNASDRINEIKVSRITIKTLSSL